MACIVYVSSPFETVVAYGQIVMQSSGPMAEKLLGWFPFFAPEFGYWSLLGMISSRIPV